MWAAEAVNPCGANIWAAEKWYKVISKRNLAKMSINWEAQWNNMSKLETGTNFTESDIEVI
jgi:hypothetical protein